MYEGSNMLNNQRIVYHVRYVNKIFKYVRYVRHHLSFEILKELASHCSTVAVTMCAYGTPYKKPTTIAFWLHGRSSIDALSAIFVNRKCRPVRLGKGKPTLCGYSKCEHMSLTGLSSSKKFNTKEAQAYPFGLAEDLVAALTGQ